MAQEKDSQIYGIGSRSYLARARGCLASGDRAQLFYAALELRCCVEARQDEYLAAQKRYRKSMPRSWQIGKKACELDRIFAEGKIAKVTMSHPTAAQIVAFHIPIANALVKQAENLGAYLHAMQEFHDSDDPWWGILESALSEIYRGAWLACKGNLLCPPFLHADGTTNIAIEFDGDIPAHWEHYRKPGTRLVATVDYPSRPPADWKCDL